MQCAVESHSAHVASFNNRLHSRPSFLSSLPGPDPVESDSARLLFIAPIHGAIKSWGVEPDRYVAIHGSWGVESGSYADLF